MSWRIWRRCSMEGSMIWERCKRDEPATGLGRSLFTPLPRHASVLDCERTSGQFLCSDNVGCNVQKPTSPRRNSCHHEHESVSLAADEALGTYGSNEQSYEDADEQRSGRGQFSAQGERSHGFHGGRRGGASRRCVERGAVEGGGLKGGGAQGGGERERCEMAEREMARCTCLRIASGTPAEPFFHNLCRPPPSPSQTQHACCFIPAMQPSPSVRPMHATARAPVQGSMHSARSSQR